MVEEALKATVEPLRATELAWAPAYFLQRNTRGATEGRLNGIVFVVGDLIALERNDRRIFSILAIALEGRDRIIVPSAALAQVIRILPSRCGYDG